MFKNKKITMIIVIASIVVMSASGTIFAGNESYYTGELYNTGQYYNSVIGARNFKLLEFMWKIKCTSTCGMRGAGINFQPYNDETGEKGGASIWIDHAIDFTYVNPVDMPIHYWYRLKARIDDDYAGPMDATGEWNSN